MIIGTGGSLAHTLLRHNIGGDSIVTTDLTPYQDKAEPEVKKYSFHTPFLTVVSFRQFPDDKAALRLWSEGTVLQVNNSTPMETWKRGRVIVSYNPKPIVDGKYLRFTAVLADTGISGIRKATKKFKFKGNETEKLTKRIAMYVYMKIACDCKDVIVESLGITRKEFTQFLIDYSGDTDKLLRLVVANSTEHQTDRR